MFIGRKDELNELQYFFDKKGAFLGVIKGRRRIGKTELLKHFSKDKKCLIFSAIKTSNKNQIKKFKLSLQQWLLNYDSTHYLLNNLIEANDWIELFFILGLLIKEYNQKTDEKILLIFDEFQWFCNHKSSFLEAFMGQWNEPNENGFENQNLLVVVCGSNTIWLDENVLKNKTGLHQRISFVIKLKPFNLIETKEFLGDKMPLNLMLKYYFITGGVAQYLNFIKPELSFEQNVNNNYIKGILNNEFNEVFFSLFGENDFYQKIMIFLSQKNQANFNDIYKHVFKKETNEKDVDFEKNKRKLYRCLKNLIDSDFINKKEINYSKYNSYYSLKDLFSYFYLKQIDGKTIFTSDHNFDIWCGYAFEKTIFSNIDLIKKWLNIDNIQTNIWSWQNNKAQIDLLLERKDKVDQIVECKHYNSIFKIGENEIENLNNKINEFYQYKKNDKKLYNNEIKLILISIYGTKIEHKYGDLKYQDLKLVDFLS